MSKKYLIEGIMLMDHKISGPRVTYDQLKACNIYALNEYFEFLLNKAA